MREAPEAQGVGEFRAVRAAAPVRVCDAGGWTDTWFAGAGLVCSLAVEPGAEVRVRVTDASADTASVVLQVGATGERYGFEPGDAPGRHPLLEAAVIVRPPAPGAAWQIETRAGVPPGCGTGTSAAVVVALLGALGAARGDPPQTPVELAVEAHAVETGLGWQSGVQDQHAAAHGGANLIAVGPYPAATVKPIPLDEEVRAELDRRLVTVYLGRPHRSSAVHDQVIARLAESHDRTALLDPLLRAAALAAGALTAGDIETYGVALRLNTEAQAELHPDLVSPAAGKLIGLAREHGAAGWKVNGAGGDGGTVTVVGPESPAALAALTNAFDATPSWRRLPLRFAPHGFHVV